MKETLLKIIAMAIIAIGLISGLVVLFRCDRDYGLAMIGLNLSYGVIIWGLSK